MRIGEIKKKTVFFSGILFAALAVCVAAAWFFLTGGWGGAPVYIPLPFVSESYAVLDVDHALVLEPDTGEIYVFRFITANRHKAKYELWHFPSNAVMSTVEVKHGEFLLSRVPRPGGVRDTLDAGPFTLEWGPPTTLFIYSDQIQRHTLVPSDMIRITAEVPDDSVWQETLSYGCL